MVVDEGEFEAAYLVNALNGADGIPLLADKPKSLLP